MEMNGGDTNSSGGQSDIFTETIPKYGKVAMLFYIPSTVKDRDDIVQTIRENGGNTVKFHECFTYQLGSPDDAETHSYFPAEVYSTKWITDSVEKGELQDKANYEVLKTGAGMEFPFDKKKIQYTIREIIIIYDWISGRKSQASRKTWESLSNEGILYCRSKESLKNFWKNWRKYPVEECISKMLAKDTRYSHNYSKPVYPHEELPGKKPKNKRTKEQIIAEMLQEQEAQDTNNEEETSAKKRIVKRKLKKKESDGLKPAPASNGPLKHIDAPPQHLEIKPVTACEQFEEIEEVTRKEDEKENLGINGATNDKTLFNEVKLQEEPMEFASNQPADEDLSSLSGFPGFDEESDIE